MSGNKLTIKLSDAQQKQIKDATGKSMSELNIDLNAIDSLSDEDLAKIFGGTKGLAEMAM